MTADDHRFSGAPHAARIFHVLERRLTENGLSESSQSGQPGCSEFVSHY